MSGAVDARKWSAKWRNLNFYDVFFSCSGSDIPFWGSACRWPTRTWLILIRFFPFAKAFEPFVNTFSAHGFPPVRLHRHFTRPCCSFSRFVAELDFTLLRYAVTLPLTVTTFNWAQSVYTAGDLQSMLCVILPMSVKNHAHAPNSRSDMTPFSELFRRTLPYYCIE